MSLLCTVTEGWTQELGPFTLLVDGVPLDLTGMTVALILRNVQGRLSTVTGDTRIDAAPTTGKVYYKPDAVDLLAKKGPYTLHWKVTDGAGDVVFFPNGAADTIAVIQA